MKKILSVVIMFVFVFALASCGEKIDPKNDLNNVKESGVLKVGLECNYKPFNWTQLDDSDGAILINGQKNMYGNGYDVSIAKFIADELDVKVELYVCEWDGLIESLKSGIIDCVIAGMSPTAERKKQIDFTNEYYNSNLVIVCKKNSEIANAKTLKDIDNSNYKIAAQQNTFHLDALTNQTSNCIVQESSDFSSMQVSLEMNAIDGYVAELPTALTIITDEQFTYVPLVNNETGFEAEASDTQVAIGLRKGSSLLDEMNKALAKISNELRNEYMENAINNQAKGIGD